MLQTRAPISRLHPRPAPCRRRAGQRSHSSPAWPTPNHAWEEGLPISAFIQPTASGDPESGCYGDARSNGYRFHEGIDIKPVARDRRGEPMDQIFAAMAGVVRYVNHQPNDGDYGRYIVIEHPDVTPSVYTLYAHLASVLPGIAAGVHVERGQAIAIMGHSSSSRIPRDRAHMHFEIGVMVTREFQSWYDWKGFGSPNERGLWHGFNLMGFDPLDFLNKWRDHQVDNLQEYFEQMKAQVTLRIATRKMPDYIERYPTLLRAPLPPGPVGGWEIQLDWTGIPFAWRPLSPTEVLGQVDRSGDDCQCRSGVRVPAPVQSAGASAWWRLRDRARPRHGPPAALRAALNRAFF